MHGVYVKLTDVSTEIVGTPNLEFEAICDWCLLSIVPSIHLNLL